MTAPTIPTSPEELEDFLHDDQKFGGLLTSMANGDYKPMRELIKNYGDATLAKNQDMGRQFEEIVQRELREFLVTSGQDITGKLDMTDVAKTKAKWGGVGITNRDKGQFYNAKAPGALLDKNKVFADAGEFFQAIWHKKEEGLSSRAEELNKKVAAYRKVVNAAGSTVPSDGGFLIPEVLRAEILQLAMEESVVRPYATVIPMDSLTVPIPAVDETSRVTNIFGGIQFYWTPEGGAGVDTSAKFSQIELVAKKLFGYAGIPNELIADSTAFRAWFGQKFPQGYGWFEDIGFLTGDGVNKPLGIGNGKGVVSVTRGTANTIVYDDIVRMYQRMYPTSIAKARWIAAIDTFQQLAELSFTPAGGTTPVPVMLWLPNAQGVPTLTLMGRPITFTEKIGPLGSTGDLQFIDFSEYLIGDRQAMSVESSNDYLFGTDKTAYRVLGRVDGRPWLNSAITPHNGSSNTLSPYVTLHSNP